MVLPNEKQSSRQRPVIASMSRQLPWFARRLARGSDRTRSLYEGSRRLLRRAELATRRRAVQGLAADPSFAIPKDLGFRVVSPEGIPEALEVARETERIVAEATRDLGSERKKQQLVTGLVNEDELTLDSPFLRFALRPEILQSASRYLAAVPILASLDVWASVPAPEIMNSQLFHCDWEDLSQVKVFVYGNQVDAATGPLVVLGADTSRRLRQRVSYRWRGERYRVTDEEATSLVGDDDRHEVHGPPGTVAMVDVSRCFHYGSRLETGSVRAVCVLQYLLPSAFSVRTSSRAPGPFARLATPDMPQVERLVLGAA